jgi:hypothetical protein
MVNYELSERMKYQQAYKEKMEPLLTDGGKYEPELLNIGMIKVQKKYKFPKSLFNFAEIMIPSVEDVAENNQIFIKVDNEDEWLLANEIAYVLEAANMGKYTIVHNYEENAEKKK